MLKQTDHKKNGHARHGWLTCCYNFLFDNYYKPENLNFGALVILSADRFAPFQQR